MVIYWTLGGGGVGCNDGQEGLSTKENSPDF